MENNYKCELKEIQASSSEPSFFAHSEKFF